MKRKVETEYGIEYTEDQIRSMFRPQIQILMRTVKQKDKETLNNILYEQENKNCRR